MKEKGFFPKSKKNGFHILNNSDNKTTSSTKKIAQFSFNIPINTRYNHTDIVCLNFIW